jgi:hypothetical protein
MLVSSTAADPFAVTRTRRKKPYFVAVPQELIASAAKRSAAEMLDCACHVA